MIHFEENNGVGVISLDSSKGNMLSLDDLQDLNAILCDGRLAVKGLVMTGLNRSFCTGLQVCRGCENEAFKLLDSTLLNLYSYKNPLAIALSGHAIGAGFLFLCCADYVIAQDSEKAKYGLPEVGLGLGVDQCMVSLLASTISPLVMKKLICTSLYVSYKELKEWQLIDEVQTEDLTVGCVSFIGKVSFKESYSFCKLLMRKQGILKMQEAIDGGCYMDLGELIRKNKHTL